METKISKEFRNLVQKGLKGSLEKQDKIFQATAKNRKLFEKAKALASF